MLPEGPLGGTADRAASLAKRTEQRRQSHSVEHAVHRHAALTCHLNPPMHMVELIRTKAFYMWLDEGCLEGRADAHWQLRRTKAASRQPRPQAPPKATENLGS
jgi:Protein of unknown function (DUF2934)